MGYIPTCVAIRFIQFVTVDLYMLGQVIMTLTTMDAKLEPSKSNLAILIKKHASNLE